MVTSKPPTDQVRGEPLPSRMSMGTLELWDVRMMGFQQLHEIRGYVRGMRDQGKLNSYLVSLDRLAKECLEEIEAYERSLDKTDDGEGAGVQDVRADDPPSAEGPVQQVLSEEPGEGS